MNFKNEIKQICKEYESLDSRAYAFADKMQKLFVEQFSNKFPKINLSKYDVSYSCDYSCQEETLLEKFDSLHIVFSSINGYIFQPNGSSYIVNFTNKIGENEILYKSVNEQPVSLKEIQDFSNWFFKEFEISVKIRTEIPRKY